jgi:hypothetical protein
MMVMKRRGKEDQAEVMREMKKKMLHICCYQ